MLNWKERSRENYPNHQKGQPPNLLIEEIDERTPFAYMMEKIEELENGNTELKEEVQKLRNSMRGHTHLVSGKSVVEI